MRIAFSYLTGFVALIKMKDIDAMHQSFTDQGNYLILWNALNVTGRC